MSISAFGMLKAGVMLEEFVVTALGSVAFFPVSVVGNFVIDRSISPEQPPGNTIPGTNIASTLSKRETRNVRAIRDL